MPIVGHVAPIAPVARELINRGHEVTWYTSKHFEDKVTGTGATFAPLVSPLDFGDGENYPPTPRVRPGGPTWRRLASRAGR